MTPTTTTEALPLRLHLGKVRLAAPAVAALEGGGAAQAGDAQWLVAEALALVEGLRPLTEAVKARLRTGGGLDLDVYALGDAVRAAFTETLALADAARSAARAAAAAVPGLDELGRATEEARGWTAAVLENWPRRDRPFEPLTPADREMIARSRAEIARGEGEDAGDILARLKAGGPLLRGE